VFLAAQTQWVRAGMDGIPTGLNYTSLESLMRLYHIEIDATDDCLDRIRVLEGKALEIIHRKYNDKSRSQTDG
jgi:hypothetical protein